MKINLFTADANYPSPIKLNSHSVFIEVAYGEETTLYRVTEIKSLHKVRMKFLLCLGEMGLVEIKKEVKGE